MSATLATLLNVPVGWISVRAAAAPTRRLQAAGDATYLTITVGSTDPAATAAKLQSLIASGSLASALSQLGLYISPNSLAVSTFPAAAAPVPATTAGTVSPAPAPAPATTTAAAKKSNVGAIVGEFRGRGGAKVWGDTAAWQRRCCVGVTPPPARVLTPTPCLLFLAGGVVGGVGGTLALGGLLFWMRRRRAAAAAATGGSGGLRSTYLPGATAQVTTTSGLSVKTAAGRLKEDQGMSSSPRNTVTPRTRAGLMA